MNSNNDQEEFELDKENFPELSQFPKKVVKQWGENLVKQFGGDLYSNLINLELDLEMEAAKTTNSSDMTREELIKLLRKRSRNEESGENKYRNCKDINDREKYYSGHQNLLFEDELIRLPRKSLLPEENRTESDYSKYPMEDQCVKFNPCYGKDVGPDRICFTHLSDELRNFFTSKDRSRPTFYWFSDRFYDLYFSSTTGIPSKYFYFFLKNPKVDKIALRSRSGKEKQFHDLYDHHLYFREKYNPPHSFAEPAILMSFSYIEPDLIAEYDKNKRTYVTIYPSDYLGIELDLFKKVKDPPEAYIVPKLFTDTILAKMFPELRQSLPFAKPVRKNGKYCYKNWIPMITAQMGSWL